MREMSEEVGKQVVPDTPVDTGHARANWVPSLNAPPIVPVTRTDKTGAGTIARIATVARQMKIGDTFYLANNVPYIEDLNQGSSPQAEPDFVGEATRRAVKIVTKRRDGKLV